MLSDIVTVSNYCSRERGNENKFFPWVIMVLLIASLSKTAEQLSLLFLPAHGCLSYLLTEQFHYFQLKTEMLLQTLNEGQAMNLRNRNST